MTVPTGLRGWNPSVVYSKAADLFASTVRTVRNPKRFKVRYVADIGLPMIATAHAITRLTHRLERDTAQDGDAAPILELLRDLRCDLNAAYLGFGIQAKPLAALDGMAEDLTTCLRRFCRGRDGARLMDDTPAGGSARRT